MIIGPAARDLRQVRLGRTFSTMLVPRIEAECLGPGQTGALEKSVYTSLPMHCPQFTFLPLP